MGLIKEPVEVDFTTISKAWTVEEEKEFSKLIRSQKEIRDKKQVHLFHKRLGTHAQIASPLS
jgi:hypothetical protein